MVVQTRCGGEASYSFGHLGVLTITEPHWRRAGGQGGFNVKYWVVGSCILFTIPGIGLCQSGVDDVFSPGQINKPAGQLVH